MNDFISLCDYQRIEELRWKRGSTFLLIVFVIFIIIGFQISRWLYFCSYYRGMFFVVTEDRVEGMIPVMEIEEIIGTNLIYFQNNSYVFEIISIDPEIHYEKQTYFQKVTFSLSSSMKQVNLVLEGNILKKKQSLLQYLKQLITKEGRT